MRSAASTKMSAPAQCARRFHTSCRLVHACGVSRLGPVKFSVSPAATTDDHARGAHHLLGADEGEVRQRHRDRNLRALVAFEARHDPHREPRDQPARDGPADHQDGETPEGFPRIGIGHAQHDETHEHAEERDGGRVVQQAFAFDDAGKAARGRNGAEDRHDRRRIRRRDDGAHEKAGRDRQRARPCQRVSHQKRRDEDGDHGKDEDRHPVVDHPPQVHPQRRLEDQRGQEDVKEDVRPDRQGEDRLGDGVEGVRVLGPEQEGRAGRDEDSERREDHRVGQAQARGQRLRRADDEEEEGRDRGEKDDVHGGTT